MKRYKAEYILKTAATFLLLAAVLLLCADNIISQVLIAVAVHEAGHISAAAALPGSRMRLEAEPVGLVIKNYGLKSYREEIVIAAAGPAASFLLSVIAGAAGNGFCSEYLYVLSGASLTFGVFNLLPALPLDGGRMLYAASARLFGQRCADILLCLLSCAVILLLLVFGFMCLRAYGDLKVLIVALWLLICYCKQT